MVKEPSAVSADLERGSSPARDAWHRLRKNRLAVAGGLMLLVLAVLCIAGPWFLHATYQEQNLDLGATPPSSAHWLGTDSLGRDLLVRLLYGGRISIGVGLCATMVALTIGVIYGAVAGYVGGKADAVMMRLVDIIYALPFTIFVILLFVAIGAVEWLTMARIVRGQVMTLKKMEFIEAAQALGYGHARIIFRHLLPNALGPIIVAATLNVGGAIITESVLSFLGVGFEADWPTWGSLVFSYKDYIGINNQAVLLPAFGIFITVLAVNYLGEGLRDAFDPRRGR